MTSKLRAVSGAAAALLLVAPSAHSQLAVTARPADPTVASAWRSLEAADLAFLETLIRHDYIYANYPGGPAFEAQLRQALAQARRETAQVRDFESYRAVLQHFIASFGDAHFSAYFSVASQGGRWPGFTARYSGGRYVVASSTIPEAKAGDVIESCDGRGGDAWADTLARVMGGPPGRETTRAALADQILVDRGNPLYALPRRCRIAGREAPLAWRPMPADGPAARMRIGEAASPVPAGGFGVSPFGPDGAWVRIGSMMASTRQEADDFQKLIDQAPSLRDKAIVVIDVRGNPGGVYNWFMAFLRGYYGQPYADYYARARLEIAPVIMNPSGEAGQSGLAGEAAAIRTPPDPPEDVHGDQPRTTVLPNGNQLIVMSAPVKAIAYPATTPPSLAKGRVYLLTDYGCGSACLSFVDEMMRFPGVTLVGAETHVDRRSGGWPMGFELPSGLAVIRLGRMVREGRQRGDNEAWAPSGENRYPGDIGDTDGIKRWLRNTVIPRDAEARGAWRQTASLKGPQ